MSEIMKINDLIEKIAKMWIDGGGTVESFNQWEQFIEYEIGTQVIMGARQESLTDELKVTSGNTTKTQ